MLLSEMLSVADIKGVLVSVYDSDEKELIRFYSEGYEKIDSALLTRTIAKWYINLPHTNSEPTELVVQLGEVDTPSGTTT